MNNETATLYQTGRVLVLFYTLCHSKGFTLLHSQWLSQLLNSKSTYCYQRITASLSPALL